MVPRDSAWPSESFRSRKTASASRAHNRESVESSRESVKVLHLSRDAHDLRSSPRFTHVASSLLLQKIRQTRSEDKNMFAQVRKNRQQSVNNQSCSWPLQIATETQRQRDTERRNDNETERRRHKLAETQRGRAREIDRERRSQHKCKRRERERKREDTTDNMEKTTQ